MSIPSAFLSAASTPRGPHAGTPRRLAIAALSAASAALGRLALALADAPPPSPSALPRLEFYADAGAPEGALYCDGELVARLPGVRRL